MTYEEASRKAYLMAEAAQQPYIDQAMAAYADALAEIDTILQAMYAKMSGVPPEEYYSYMVQRGRLEKLKANILSAYNEKSKQAAKSTKKGLEVATEESYNGAAYVALWATAFKVSAMPEDLVKYTVTGDIKYWNALLSSVKKKFGGNPALYGPATGTLSALFTGRYQAEAAKILQTVDSALKVGKSYQDLGKEVSAIIGEYAKTKTGETATGASYNALRIARTEGQRVINAATLANIESISSQGFDVKKQWKATEDNRTRADHRGLDGQQQDPSDPFQYGDAYGQGPGQMNSASQNINCRCNLLTIVDGIEPETMRAKNPVTGDSEVINFGDYDEYLKQYNL